MLCFEWNGKFPKKRNRVLQTYDFETEWVLFLDGAGPGNVVRRSEAEFRRSWSRAKWHILFAEE